ncbi:MAG: hypothetical protein LBN97_02685 [Oscillospiraceae bacterium]|jgi:hypothetical protein|nr:hypothetical protein [Oscillospiraceae bacterium]
MKDIVKTAARAYAPKYDERDELSRPGKFPERQLPVQNVKIAPDYYKRIRRIVITCVAVLAILAVAGYMAYWKFFVN